MQGPSAMSVSAGDAHGNGHAQNGHAAMHGNGKSAKMVEAELAGEGEPEGFTDMDVLKGEDADAFSVHSGDEGHFSDDDETAASLLLGDQSFTRLETISARVISRLVLMDNFIYLLALIYTLTFIVLLNTKLSSEFPLGATGDSVTVARLDLDGNNAALYVDIAIKLLCFGICFVMTIIFTVRVFRLSSKQRQFEQFWVIFLGWAASTYLMPYESIISLIDLTQLDNFTRNPLEELEQNIVYAVRLFAFTMATVFYIWGTAHSYRLLRGRLTYVFYVPKLLVVYTYVVLQMSANFALDTQVSPVPFTTFFAMCKQLAQGKILGETIYLDYAVIYTVVLTVYELLVVLWVVRDIVVTRKVLNRVSYVRFRTKQIGFRFFLYDTLTFYGMFWLVYFLLCVAVPVGTQILSSFGGLTAFDSPVILYRADPVLASTDLILLVYVLTEMFVKLPADARGIKGWFKSQPPAPAETTDSNMPISYRKRESVSFSGVFEDLGANTFVMQTHVMLFNFAWYVYYHGTKKAENFKLEKDTFDFTISKLIQHKATDTNAIVVDGSDRIIVSFRGTTSAKNLKTDIAIKLRRLDATIPTARDEARIGFAEDLQWVYENPLYTKGRLHQGFSEAYQAVAEAVLIEVRDLYKAKRRPVFLTGHSLGGCLATLCSLDLALSLGLGKRELFVSTFGSPRLGNAQFRELYNQIVPIHWRFALTPDLVTKLPKIGYKHCGKKVLVTTGGELFLDPNALELKIWHGETASVLYHRKASYLLAIRGWCELHHGDEYVPPFWAWPVGPEDSKRFESLGQRSSNSSVRSRSTASKKSHTDQYRLLARDSLLNKLDGNAAYGAPVAAPKQDDVFDQWARLTRRLLITGMPSASGETKREKKSPRASPRNAPR
ncbi:Phospholipase A1-II 1 [Porphyridium purpureum]|uniref:Phospholipase A1-II 1 n=1 Tax=Porphyridium purpureum TaxID=35688 RepID=A0A5J4Z2H6_PORPP|nr:Phospholipase A1-II 1 [Porphyridium purpureum]|eukprot:POR2844..scf208_2